jgi:hypothetical protein
MAAVPGETKPFNPKGGTAMKFRSFLLGAFLVIIFMCSTTAWANTQFYGQYDMYFSLWSPVAGQSQSDYMFLEVGGDFSRRDVDGYLYLPAGGGNASWVINNGQSQGLMTHYVVGNHVYESFTVFSSPITAGTSSWYFGTFDFAFIGGNSKADISGQMVLDQTFFTVSGSLNRR